MSTFAIAVAFSVAIVVLQPELSLWWLQWLVIWFNNNNFTVLYTHWWNLVKEKSIANSFFLIYACLVSALKSANETYSTGFPFWRRRAPRPDCDILHDMITGLLTLWKASNGAEESVSLILANVFFCAKFQWKKSFFKTSWIGIVIVDTFGTSLAK